MFTPVIAGRAYCVFVLGFLQSFLPCRHGMCRTIYRVEILVFHNCTKKITVVKLMEKTAYKQARLVLCKDRFITGMTRRSAKKLPMQQKQDVHRMGRKHEENQKRAEIQEML